MSRTTMQNESRPNAGKDETAFLDHREKDKIDRNDESHQQDRGSARPGVDLTGSEKSHSPVSQHKHHERKQEAAGVESPGKHQSRREHSHVIKRNRR